MDIPTSIGLILLWALVKKVLSFVFLVLFFLFGLSCLVIIAASVVAKLLVVLVLAAPEFDATAQMVFIDTLFPVFLKTALFSFFSFIFYFLFKQE